ncbi:SDR family oxidoreductase [Streptomyces meridianus]|uniref:SDR family NAD(P)-dependent oxidoreductase n=1 Tax=Streptomyces meridianus TaxID=2938945 RepID=A0ABT0XEA6_9ACTN|nr:SDR family NAD(P)-dependent oxidoreductase [Streptomyces meridianus]MCM2580144.1 SDR family NAD(P)-dependent oxidoreductase [Streptomyces meridianus]
MGVHDHGVRSTEAPIRTGGIGTGLPLSGCAALVTGASSGIGAATAMALAREGAAVALVARRTGRLEELAATIRNAGGSCAVLTADLRDSGQARCTVEEAAKTFGRLDILVNNAASVTMGPFEEIDPEDVDHTVDLNLTAVLHTSRAALPHLLNAAADGPRQAADLVNVSSLAGRIARKNNSVYSATKHAVGAFSEALRQEVTGRRLRVGLVEPGMTTTEMATGAGAGAARGLPQQAWLRSEDVARCLTFMITQPPHVAINEIMVRPTVQEH